MNDDDDRRTDDESQPRADQIVWDIRRTGRAWVDGEAWQRWELTPEKLEMWNGKALFDDNERLLLLGLLLENVGADAAVRLGRPEVWREAVASLSVG
jgi:hypothetical protein